jgi:MoaA/NifB/PqqE/SkfB family radical SAM enzyme
MYQEMQLSDWKRTLIDAYKLGCRKVQFIGGEPTIYPHLIELIETSRQLGYTFIEVFTNGTHFTENIKQAFLVYQVSLAFSVYSAEDSIHDAVTLRRGSHARTIESLKWALQVGLSVRASIIDVGINSEGIERTIASLKELGVTSIGVDRNRGIGRGTSNTTTDSLLDELCGRCWQGKLCVTPSGEIFPCIFSRFAPVGNIRNGLSSVIQGEHLRSFRSSLRSRFQKRFNMMDSCEPVCQPVCSPIPCTPQCGPDCGPAKCSPQER